MLNKLTALTATAVAVLAVATAGHASNSAAGPDLVVSDTTSTSVTVSNEGNRRAGRFTVTVRGNSCSSFSFEIARLAAGATVRRAIPSCSRSRVARVDRYNNVRELEEDNNRAWVPTRNDRYWDDRDDRDWDRDNRDWDRDDERSERDYDRD